MNRLETRDLEGNVRYASRNVYRHRSWRKTLSDIQQNWNVADVYKTPPHISQQDTQCTYNVKRWRVSVTNVAVEKQ
jgi:hypothetical protein